MDTPDPAMTMEQETDAMAADAPLGYTKAGTPRRRRPGAGRKPGQRRVGGPAAPPKTSQPRKSSRAARDYTPVVELGVTLLALPLKFVSPLDAAALLLHRERLAFALNETAKDRPEIAQWLDTLMAVGPYGLIIEAFMPVAAQVAENHGWMPTAFTTKFGAVPRPVLMTQLHDEADRQAAARARAEDEPPLAHTFDDDGQAVYADDDMAPPAPFATVPA